jgi:hypothetical protein
MNNRYFTRKEDVIYTTYDYSIFELHELNRTVRKNSQKFKDLVKSIKQDGFRREFPIGVFKTESGRFKVVSGHNRLVAAQEAGAGVKFVFIEIPYHPAKMEVGPGQWNQGDFFDSHCNAGENPAYLEIRAYMDKTGITLNNAVSMFFGQTAGSGNYMQDGNFKTGEFVIRDREHPKKVGDIVLYLKNIGVEFATQNSFVRALSYIAKAPEFDVDRFKQKAKANYVLFEKQRNVENYVDLIEKVYNHRSKKEDKVPLSFIAQNGARVRSQTFGKKNFVYIKPEKTNP